MAIQYHNSNTRPPQQQVPNCTCCPTPCHETSDHLFLDSYSARKLWTFLKNPGAFSGLRPLMASRISSSQTQWSIYRRPVNSQRIPVVRDGGIHINYAKEGAELAGDDIMSGLREPPPYSARKKLYSDLTTA
ncbi:hypothetical protein HAX54_045552 [Datura stramonium]|uniref:Uncharacterized protein n=1 Tax=Datura stramonium TaxID=4076 RepID=A0ABS8WFX1_DATST|nr:hypothetical protein [Datura stramonium]